MSELSKTAKLDVYIVMWSSFVAQEQLVPWNSVDPRKVAERVLFMIWKYVQEWGGVIRQLGGDGSIILTDGREIGVTGDWIALRGSVIGHAALFAKYTDADETNRFYVFSNTGGDVGFYHLGEREYPTRYLRESPHFIPACFYVRESYVEHVADGYWETLKQFSERVKTRTKPLPRVRKEVITGSRAKEVSNRMAIIEAKTRTEYAGFGGPTHFGLNTTKVRLVNDVEFDHDGHVMTRFDVGDEKYEIHGGCANAVATVLKASGLEHLVETSAYFENELTFEHFEEAVLPLIVSDGVFRSDGTAKDTYLVGELRDWIPSRWIEPRNRVRNVAFYDPNYWYHALEHNSSNYGALKHELGLGSFGLS